MESIRTMTLEIGEAPFRLTAVICGSTSGIQVYVGGGTLPHIGSVVLAEPKPGLEGRVCNLSTFNREGHKDGVVAHRFAEALCFRYNCPVSVSAGIHIDNAAAEDIQRLVALSDQLLEQVLDAWDVKSE
ncbi:MAG: hypothetical protein IJO79_05645 [Firmicutes bacterium]|nr:hypothetical protein [Bacillota bacterium]